MSYHKMERGWLDSDMFGDDPYDDRGAWAWMIAEARWEDGFSPINGSPMPVKRGQFYASVRFMSKRFQWSTNRVLRFLEKLKKWNSIFVSTETGKNLITICNYSRYQDNGDTSGDEVGDTNGDTSGDEVGDKLEELNNNKKGKKDSSPQNENQSFEKFWKDYPKQRVGSKDKARQAYEKAIREKRATAEEIENGVSAYRVSDEVGRGFAKGAAAWLNDDRWKNDYAKPRQGSQRDEPQASHLDKVKAAGNKALERMHRRMEAERDEPWNQGDPVGPAEGQSALSVGNHVTLAGHHCAGDDDPQPWLNRTDNTGGDGR